MNPAIVTRSITTLSQVEAVAWDRLVDPNDPFLEHSFLLALETSGSVGTEESGWIPRHVVAYQGGTLVGAVPLYEKHDSYGEYIFDWSWASAALRAGIPYYPKLVAAVPFSPVSGQRLLVAADADWTTVAAALLAAVQAVADDMAASSIHFLFSSAREQTWLAQQAFLPRLTYQFHWSRRPHWYTFADYLASMRAPARKQVNKERRTAQSHGLTLTMRPGTAMSDAEWDSLWRFYGSTIRRKGAIPYLTRAFFQTLRHATPQRVLAALALRGDHPVAGALYLHRGQHLYGRYWGATEPLDALHFELCYYQPIAWALQHGVSRFEAGAQGEHKLKRGLLPSPCYSAHWLRHPALARAVADYLPQESTAVAAEMQELAGHSPFKASEAEP